MRAIKKLANKLVSTETEKQKYNKLVQMTQTDGWQIYMEYLLYMRGFMAEDLFSKEFTEKTPAEKDILQRAYSMVSEVILFLTNPLEEARRVAAYKRHNQAMEATKRKQPTKKGTTARK
jgi:hypothetical protein